MNLLARRIVNQRLTRSEFSRPADVIGWLGAVQAQDYPAARWAVGQRVKGLTDADVEQAFDAGTILRTHILRPTWHFVAANDIRWMLALSGPRVNAINASYYSTLEIDQKIAARSRRVLERALGGGKHLTRAELGVALARGGIPATGVRLAHLMMRAELDAVVCSGGRRGQQSTYALLDERAPRATPMTREEAIAELARRYFTSHGPATLRDFGWWSGLTVRDARAGVESIKPALFQEEFGGRTYWSGRSKSSGRSASSTAYLLPNFDELLVAYRDREPLVGSRLSGTGPRGSDVFVNSLVIRGRLAGSWRKTVRPDSLHLHVSPYGRLTADDKRALGAAAARYGRFLGIRAVSVDS